MLRYLSIAFGLFASIGLSEAQEPVGSRWANYSNDRYGFGLTYPIDVFARERTSESGDGQLFASRAMDARLLVGALPNSDRHTPASYQDYIARESYGDYQVGYHKRGRTWFVLSGEGNGQTFYEKVIFSCKGSLINSFAMIYPTEHHQIFDPIVERIEDTFHAGKKDCPHMATSDQTKPTPHDGLTASKPKYSAAGSSVRSRYARLLARNPGRRSAFANRIAKARGTDVIVIMRRVGPPYDYKVLRGYASQ